MNICLEHAEATRSAAGGTGYVVDSHVESIKDNYKNNTLLKNLR